jgi:tRNA(fMet)-specific endonuclease VapC
MSYLLDTNTVSDLIRNPNGRAARRLASAGEDNACTSIIVAAELRFGAERASSVLLSAKVDQLLGRLKVMAFESPADRVYAEIRTQLERSGKPISANDMLIAAHALALDCTLVTDNGREFSRIKKLKIENWLR